MSLQSDLNNVKQKEDEKIDEKTKSEITTSSSSTINTKKEKFSTSLIKPQEKKPDDTFVTRNFPAIVGWISILLSIAECGVLIFEYLFINTIFHSLFRALAPYLVNTDQAESRLRINLSALDSQARGSLFSQLIFFTLTALKQDFSYIFCSIVCIFVWVYIVCYYFFWRYGITPKREKHFKMFDLSSTGKFTLQIILSGFACMVLIQMFSPGPRIFSLDNFFVFNEKRDVILAINYPKIGQILIGTPIIEEIVLRFIMTTVMVKKSKNAIYSICMTNIAFSILHFVNVFAAATRAYTIFQAISAIIVGTYYSTRFILTENILECIILHAMNNATAIFYPVTLEVKKISPFYWGIAILSILIYVNLLVKDIVEIRKKFKI